MGVTPLRDAWRWLVADPRRWLAEAAVANGGLFAYRSGVWRLAYSSLSLPGTGRQ